MSESNTIARTQFLDVRNQTYAYRRFGRGDGYPLLFLQHFVGTLDNWDPAVTDPLASHREVILFDNAGVGQSSGQVATTVEGMAEHALAFIDALGLDECDVLGFSLGGMVAQELARHPALVRKMILIATAPRGGEDVMRVERSPLSQIFADRTLTGYTRLQKLFFAPTASSQKAGAEFIARLERRATDRDPVSGSEIAQAQLAAFREWEQFGGERFAYLRSLEQPTLVVNGVLDQLIPVRNSYWLSENLPKAILLTYPDSGHGSIFQYHDAFTRQVAQFLDEEMSL